MKSVSDYLGYFGLFHHKDPKGVYLIEPELTLIDFYFDFDLFQPHKRSEDLVALGFSWCSLEATDSNPMVYVDLRLSVGILLGSVFVDLVLVSFGF